MEKLIQKGNSQNMRIFLLTFCLIFLNGCVALEVRTTNPRPMVSRKQINQFSIGLTGGQTHSPVSIDVNTGTDQITEYKSEYNYLSADFTASNFKVFQIKPPEPLEFYSSISFNSFYWGLNYHFTKNKEFNFYAGLSSAKKALVGASWTAMDYDKFKNIFLVQLDYGEDNFYWRGSAQLDLSNTSYGFDIKQTTTTVHFAVQSMYKTASNNTLFVAFDYAPIFILDSRYSDAAGTLVSYKGRSNQGYVSSVTIGAGFQ
jgi:hypothetical protein